MQTIHKLGGAASTELIAHELNQEVAHIVRYAVKHGLLVSPGHHGRNLNAYRLTRLGQAYVVGFAERKRYYPAQSKYPQQLIAYSWMAPLMESPEAVEELDWVKHTTNWFDVVSSEHGARVAEHANQTQ